MLKHAQNLSRPRYKRTKDCL